MNEQRFWELIQAVHEQSSGEMEGKCEGIKYAIENFQAKRLFHSQISLTT